MKRSCREGAHDWGAGPGVDQPRPEPFEVQICRVCGTRRAWHPDEIRLYTWRPRWKDRRR